MSQADVDEMIARKHARGEPKAYRFLADQVGTDDPDITVLENSLSGPVVWERTGSGIYIGTLPGAFPLAGTFLLGNPTEADGGVIALSRVNDNAIAITTPGGDDFLTNWSGQVLVYSL